MADACLSNEFAPIAEPCVWLRLNRHQLAFVGLCGGRPPLALTHVRKSRIENSVGLSKPRPPGPPTILVCWHSAADDDGISLLPREAAYPAPPRVSGRVRPGHQTAADAFYPAPCSSPPTDQTASFRHGIFVIVRAAAP